MSLIERIYELTSYKNDSIYKLSKGIGVSNGYFAKTRLNQGNISSHIIEKVINFYPDINIEWLITGKGEMFRNENDESDLLLYKEQKSRSVPFYNLPVSAGEMGAIAFDPLGVKAEGHVCIESFKNCTAVLPVVGVSMEPIVNSGDLIGVREIESVSERWDFIETGRIYLIITRYERMIKYIESTTKFEDCITCISPNYGSFKVAKDEILQIYKVEAVLRSV